MEIIAPKVDIFYSHGLNSVILQSLNNCETSLLDFYDFFLLEKFGTIVLKLCKSTLKQ